MSDTGYGGMDGLPSNLRPRLIKRIYVASSWRNKRQPKIVKKLKNLKYEVYDFKNPEIENKGFQWSDIDYNWKDWTPKKFKKNLNHPIAENGFKFDMDALKWCDACVLVMPCGRSAHLELGYCIGKSKYTIILLSDGEPELMYKMAKDVCINMKEIEKSLANENYRRSCK